MKGYNVPEGYMGYIQEEGIYRLFASEMEYLEYIEDLY